MSAEEQEKKIKNARAKMERLVVGPRGAPEELYHLRCFEENYVPNNFPKFNAEKAIGLDLADGNFSHLSPWLYHLHCRYSPADKIDYVDWTRPMWTWAASWHNGRVCHRRQRHNLHAVVKRDALGFAALLRHYGFIVALAKSFWRALTMRSHSEIDPRDDTDQFGLMWSGKHTRHFAVNDHRIWRTPTAWCFLPRPRLLETARRPISLGKWLADWVARDERGYEVSPGSLASWVSGWADSGVYLETVMQSLVAGGQVDCLSILLESSKTIALSDSVKEQFTRLISVLFVATLAYDSASTDSPTMTLFMLKEFPEVQANGALRIDLNEQLMSSGRVELVRHVLASPVPDAAEVMTLIQLPFRHYHRECCMSIINPQTRGLDARAIANNFPRSFDWSEILRLLLDEWKQPPADSINTEAAECCKILAAVTAHHPEATIPSDWEVPEGIRVAASPEMWSWILGQREDIVISTAALVKCLLLYPADHRSLTESEKDSRVDAFRALYENYNVEEEDDIPILEPEFVQALIGDSIDHEALAGPHRRFLTPLGMAVAYQPVIVVKKMLDWCDKSICSDIEDYEQKLSWFRHTGDYDFGAAEQGEFSCFTLKLPCWAMRLFLGEDKPGAIFGPEFPVPGVTWEAVLALLGTGAEVNTPSSRGYRSLTSDSRVSTTPFLELVSSEQATPEQVETLVVDYGAHVEAPPLPPPPPDHYFYYDEEAPPVASALHVAVLPSTIKKLHQLGARVTVTDVQARTPLHYAVEPNCSRPAARLEELLKLFDNEAALSQDSGGNTPLHLAVRWENVAGLVILLQHFSKKAQLSKWIAAKNVEKETALGMALRRATGPFNSPQSHLASITLKAFENMLKGKTKY